MAPSEAAFMAALMASMLVALAVRKVRSTQLTFAVGTRKLMPVSLPFTSGSTSAHALAAPVEAGMMFMYALRPPRQSFFEGPSCVGCVAVTACTVVIRPSSMPQCARSTFTTGARQLVVQLAFEMMVSFAGSYCSWFTLKTKVRTLSSLLVGALMMTRLAPAARCCDAPSNSVKRPVDSSTMSTPRSFHGSFEGSFSLRHWVFLPLHSKPSAVAVTRWPKRPCMVS